MTILSLDSEPEDVGNEELIRGGGGGVNAAVVKIMKPLEGLVIGYAHQAVCDSTAQGLDSHAHL